MSDEANFTVRLTQKVKGPAKVANRAVNELDASLHKVGKTARESGGFLDGAMDVFKGNLLTAGVSKIVSMGGALAATAGQLIMFRQNSTLAMGQLAKHGAEPAKLLEHASALAKRFGLDVVDTTKQYQKFLALQFDPHGADKLIRMGADLRALGTDAEGVQGVFMALGQIKGKGRLQGEEMLQLAERGVSTVLIQEEIGKLMGGKDITAVQKLMQKGKVDAETGLQAIENAIKRKLGESELGEAGAKFADTTIEGIAGKFKAWAQDSGLRVLDKVAAPITEKMGNAFNHALDWLTSADGATTIERISVAIGKAAEMAGAFADEFTGSFGETWTKLSDGAKPFFELIGGSNGTEMVVLLGRSLGQIAALAVGTAIAFGAVAAGATVLAGGLWQVGTAILDGILQPIGTAIGGIISWWDTITAIWDDGSKGIVEKAWMLGSEIVTGLVEGINALAWMPIDAIASVGTKVADTLAGILGIHSPSRVTMDMGMQLGRGMEIGIDRSTSGVSASSADMAIASVPSFSDLGSPSAGESSSIGATFNWNGDIIVQGGGANAQELGESLRTQIRSEVVTMFRMAALEV